MTTWGEGWSWVDEEWEGERKKGWCESKLKSYWSSGNTIKYIIAKGVRGLAPWSWHLKKDICCLLPFLDRSLMIGWRKNASENSERVSFVFTFVSVCVSVCLHAGYRPHHFSKSIFVDLWNVICVYWYNHGMWPIILLFFS